MEKAKKWIPSFVGIGMTIIAMVFPQLYPDMHTSMLQLLLYFGIFLILFLPIVFLYKYLSGLNLKSKNLMYIPGIVLLIVGIIWIFAVYRNTAPLPKEEKPKVVAGLKNQETQPNASSSFQDRLLFMAAAEEGNISAIESLLDKGVDVNTIDRDGYTALIWAAVYGQKACVQKLIEKGSKVDVKNDIGWTALITASHNGHKAIVELLIENDADVNVKTNDRNTALTFASFEGYDEIVNILKKSGAVFVKYQDDKILTAALKGDVNTLKALLEKGVSPNTIDRIGSETPLMYAVGRNHIECVKLLLEFGADVNIRAKDGHTVFDDARDRPEMLKLIESPVKQTVERKSHENTTFIVFNPNAFPPAILNSQNISGSITDNGVLDFTFSFDEPLQNENYMIETAETASFKYKLYDRTRDSFSIKFEEPCPDLVKLEFVF